MEIKFKNILFTSFYCKIIENLVAKIIGPSEVSNKLKLVKRDPK